MSIFLSAKPNASSPTVFLSESLHCSLGATIEDCLKALRQPPQSPQLYDCHVIEDVSQIPYKLLAGKSLDDLERRLRTVILDVAASAIDKAGLTLSQRQRMGLFVGSSSFDVSASEQEFKRELQECERPIALRNPCFGRLANHLVETLGIRGPDFSINTACTASANALVAAVEQVDAGLLDHALVLGIESYNDITALGFQGLGLLSRSVMKPFDDSRDGLVLGEGVSAIVVGRDPGDGKRRFALQGSASLCDPYSISASAPDGSTIHQVMQQALDNAGLTTGDIAAIKVHGTASLSNDEAESAGMKSLFSRLPPVCALKPFIGHTLGACGLNELILFYRALEAGFLVATPGIAATDAGALGVQLNQQYEPLPPGNFMLNYFGFGGNNCSLVISNLEAGR